MPNNTLYDWSGTDIDMTPRYAPDRVMIAGHGECAVVGSAFYPPFQHPKPCCIREDMGLLELRTIHGTRRYGVQHAYINAELRMVVVGTFKRDEVRMKWKASGERS